MDNVWTRCFSPFFSERSFKSRQNPRVDFFLRQEKTLNDSKWRFSIYCCWVLCSMNCLQFPFIRVEEVFSWTQRFLTRKFGPKTRILFMTNKFESKCLQKFSTSCEKLHKNPCGCKLGESTENNKALLFSSGKETIQTFNCSI